MMMSIEDFEYYNNYTYEKKKTRDEREERERRNRFLIKNVNRIVGMQENCV